MSVCILQIVNELASWNSLFIEVVFWVVASPWIGFIVFSIIRSIRFARGVMKGHIALTYPKYGSDVFWIYDKSKGILVAHKFSHFQKNNNGRHLNE